MNCGNMVWEEISAATVANCFSDTGLFVSSALPSVSDQQEHIVECELQDALIILSLRKPMAISNLINTFEEDEAAHLMLNDIEIIQMIQGAEEEEEQEEQVERIGGDQQGRQLQVCSC